MNTYFEVRQGFSLRTAKGDLHMGGAIVDLTEDEFKLNEHKLEVPSKEKLRQFEEERKVAMSGQNSVDAKADAKRKAELQANANIAARIAANAAAASKAV